MDRRRAGWIASTVTLTDGVYVIDTTEIVSGPPIGTETFDTRKPTDMPHCAA